AQASDDSHRTSLSAWRPRPLWHSASPIHARGVHLQTSRPGTDASPDFRLSRAQERGLMMPLVALVTLAGRAEPSGRLVGQDAAQARGGFDLLAGEAVAQARLRALDGDGQQVPGPRLVGRGRRFRGI